MATRHPEIFAALCQPFPPSEVKTRNQAGRSLSYITARSAMNRLDAVLGPENWRDSYFETDKGIKCRIEFRVGESPEWLWKEDGGAQAGMPEVDNDEKSGYSDAFKRAAVKLGVARYLYKDGVPAYDGTPEPAPAADHSRADTVRTPAPVQNHAPAPARPAPSVNGIPAGFVPPDGLVDVPRSGKALWAIVSKLQELHNAKFVNSLNDWGKKAGKPNRLVEWEGDDLTDAHTYLSYLVAKHTGVLESAPAPSANGNGNGEAAGLRKAIISRAGEILNRTTGHMPNDPEIGNKLRGLWSELFAGSDMGKFGQIADSARLRTMQETLDMEFKELDDCPF